MNTGVQRKYHTDATMTSPRPYTKTRRAELEQRTRERITEAAVELHGSLGPAQTTISAIAQRAGVQRATVYRHFPDEQALFAACSAHWVAQNEPPDLAAWAAIRDPADRLAVALSELYAWYGRTHQMLELLTRDLPLVPALQTQFRLPGYLDAAADVLLAGRPERGAARRRARAALGHAVAFETWLSLVRQQGLTSTEAIRLMERMSAR
jgi:AcrR family transcriptional regulator